MKHFRNLLTMSLALLAFASCSKDEAGSDPGYVSSGEPTYASFSFKVGGTSDTRASMGEENADENASAVKNITLLIFEGNDLGGRLEVNRFIDGGATATTVQATSGVKRIYVIANAGDATTGISGKLRALTEGSSTLQDFYSLMTDGEGNDADMGDEFKALHADGAMLMSNVADLSAKKTLQPGITKEQSESAGTSTAENFNNFTFTVSRAVAKGSVKIQLKGNQLATEDGFTLSSTATVVVRNLNRSTYFVQQYMNHNVDVSATDHASDGALRPVVPFYNKFDGLPADKLVEEATFAPYYFKYAFSDGKAATMAAAGGTATASKAVYFSPNSNNLSLRGNTSYFGIRTQITNILADKIAKKMNYSVDGVVKITSEPADANYDGTQGFYCIREIPADVLPKLGAPVRKVFTTQEGALEAMYVILTYSASVNLSTQGFTNTGDFSLQEFVAAVKAGTTLNAIDMQLIDRFIGHYENGYCYYRLNIYETAKPSDTKRHLIRRNHSYAATITSFKSLGDPTEGDLDKEPEKPVDADATYVTATISIAPWHNVNMSDDL